MKKYVITALSAVLALGMAGCSSDDSPMEPEQKPNDNIIRLDASIDGVTRVTAPDAQGVQSFENGDKINLLMYAGDNTEPVNANCGATFNGTTWQYDTDPLTWIDDVSRHYIFGIYPNVQVGNYDHWIGSETIQIHGVKIDLDYTKKENQDDTERVNDYLIAYNSGGHVKSDGPVNLKFTHAMSRLCVTVKLGKDVNATPADIKGVMLGDIVSGGYISVKSSGIMEYIPGYNSNLIRLRNQVTPKEGNDAAYRGIIFPQEVHLIGVGVGDKMFTYVAPKHIKLEPNKHTDIYLELKSDRIDLFGVSIKKWDEKINTPLDNDDVTITDSDKQQ